MSGQDPKPPPFMDHMPGWAKGGLAILAGLIFLMASVGVNVGLWINKSLEEQSVAGKETRAIEADREAKALDIVFDMVRRGAAGGSVSPEQIERLTTITKQQEALSGQVRTMDQRLLSVERDVRALKKALP